MRQAVPVAMSQPTRFVDLSFELVLQTINLQRRLVYEVLSILPRVMAEQLSDPESRQSSKSQNGSTADRGGRTRPSRRLIRAGPSMSA